LLTGVQRLRPSDDIPPGGGPGDAPFEGSPVPREDLPYRIELWNARKTEVELVLAVTASASIGFAAYFAATREYPDRYVALRHRGSFVSRWNGPTH
jgi:hypothetical protein